MPTGARLNKPPHTLGNKMDQVQGCDLYQGVDLRELYSLPLRYLEKHFIERG
ncbi:MAG: hypothetical protein M3Z85_15410 [Acidobacteriota bacterium]|nr:hypothetical protein [Acidobacteriota bacterium]